jgi:hypothetical protein
MTFRQGDDLTEEDRTAIDAAVTQAHEILNGAVTPADGARRIWWESFNRLYDQYLEGNELIDSLALFVGLADEWEEAQGNVDARQRVDQQIIAAARNLVELASNSSH